MSTIKWWPTCCVWHGEYAEHSTRDGGLARLKRAPDSDKWLVMVFGPDNKATTTADGVPVYVEMTEADALALLTP